jgi:hypothetical protein
MVGIEFSEDNAKVCVLLNKLTGKMCGVVIGLE